jgi:hypothetical protein
VLQTIFVTCVAINKVYHRCDESICTWQAMDAVVELTSVVKRNLPLNMSASSGPSRFDHDRWFSAR